jgi:hypothetical protein
MDEYMRKPLIPYKGNGIDFIYTEESRQLSCNVRFSSLVVSDAKVATDRIPSADVCVWPASNAYVGAWFLYQGSVFEVERIDGNVAICKDPDDDSDAGNPTELPLPLVSDLVNSFGR